MKYLKVLDDLLQEMEVEEKMSPQGLGYKHEKTSHEAMARDAICQILSETTEARREKYFERYPPLKEYYSHRIQH